MRAVLALLFITMGLILSLTMTSCGYHFGNNVLQNRYTTVTVPFAEGDFDGTFTTEMIRQISVNSIFQYRRVQADLILKIRLIDYDTSNIGYRYYVKEHEKDHHSSTNEYVARESLTSISHNECENKIESKITHETIPVETRLFVTAEVSMIDACSGLEVLSPVLITSMTDFDHDYYSTTHQINEFSLGQLTDYDDALDAARRPLFVNLARKIADYLADGW